MLEDARGKIWYRGIKGIIRVVIRTAWKGKLSATPGGLSYQAQGVTFLKFARLRSGLNPSSVLLLAGGHFRGLLRRLWLHGFANILPFHLLRSAVCFSVMELLYMAGSSHPLDGLIASVKAIQLEKARLGSIVSVLLTLCFLSLVYKIAPCYASFKGIFETYIEYTLWKIDINTQNNIPLVNLEILFTTFEFLIFLEAEIKILLNLV